MRIESGRLAALAISCWCSHGAAAQTCEPHWVERFPGADLSGLPSTFEVFDDGSGSGPMLYAGGSFNSAGPVQTRRVARFDGSRWFAMGDGFSDGNVFDLQGFDDGSGPMVYAGGTFTRSGGLPVNYIARWDGAAWSPVADGFDDLVRALAVVDDGSGTGPTLYAGGDFSNAGVVPVNHVAAWNGASWEPVGTGRDGEIGAMVVHDDGLGGGPALYAADFTGVEQGAIFVIARWDGETWSEIGTGIGIVTELTVFDDGRGAALYASGYLAQINGIDAGFIARWDGTTWTTLGDGLDGVVYGLGTYDEPGGASLYASGFFTTAGGMPVDGIAKWDGADWAPVGTGLDGWAITLVEFDGMLHAGGLFHRAGDLETDYMAKWDGTTWFAMGNGMDDAVYALSAHDDGSGAGERLFAGGQFRIAGGRPSGLIAAWDGDRWSDVGGGLSGAAVVDMTVSNEGGDPVLYAGGVFDEAGGQPASSIAKWDGVTWSPLGTGVDSQVYALEMFDDGSGDGDVLFAGGRFTNAGGVQVNRIARWDGVSWSSVGNGTNDTVWALCVFDDGSGAGETLYVGGAFTAAGGVQAPGIAKWDSATWSAVGDNLTLGTSDAVLALAGYDDGSGPALHAGGEFEVDGQLTRFAKFDGASWTTIGNNDVSGQVWDLVVVDDGYDDHPALYVGGWFGSAGGLPVRRVARWNGTSWSALDDGIQGNGTTRVYTLNVFDAPGGDGPALFAGGIFDRSSGVPANHIAEWQLCARIFGDLDGDLVVGIDDFSILLEAWGPCAEPCPPSCPADLDGDCIVGIRDFLLLLRHWTFDAS